MSVAGRHDACSLPSLDAYTSKVLWRGPPRQATNTAFDKAGGLLFLLNDDAELPSVPNGLALAGIRCVEPFLGDVTLTRQELLGLQQELLISHDPPLGKQSALDWLRTQHDFGRRYVNDVHRHFGTGKNTPVLDPRRSHNDPT